MKFTTVLLGLGSAVGVSLTGFLGYHMYDLSRFDNCVGYGDKDTVETCVSYGQYQDEVRYHEYETLKTSNVKIRCTDKTWHWDRTGTPEDSKIFTSTQLDNIANSYCNDRKGYHQ